MKKILACILAAFMLLAAVACTANTAPNDPKSDTTDNNTDTPAVTMTAQDILDSLKKSLGSSWASDTAETEDRMSGYWGLDMSQIESWAAEDGTLKECAGWTNIFIYPGYRFKALDCLITNFHLPESTLIMLVSALAGREHVLAAYKEAVEQRYRFFSFGDAMFIG